MHMIGQMAYINLQYIIPRLFHLLNCLRVEGWRIKQIRCRPILFHTFLMVTEMIELTASIRKIHTCLMVTIMRELTASIQKIHTCLMVTLKREINCVHTENSLTKKIVLIYIETLRSLDISCSLNIIALSNTDWNLLSIFCFW